MAGLAGLEKWLVSSNDAITISMVQPARDGLKSIGKFNPEFTYTIFGEEEQVFGYSDLKIDLRYRANDMRPHVQTSYKEKFKPLGSTEAMDITEMLKSEGRLPPIAFAKAADFESNSKTLGDNFTPPGELHASFEAGEEQFEIWKGSLDDPAIKQLNARLQVLVPLFIEGGSFIQEIDDNAEPANDDDRWTLFLLYRKQKSSSDASKSSYTFVGYSTIYRFFYFQPPSPPASPQAEWELPTGDLKLAAMPNRTRLSQFMILPPFQRKGLGRQLYQRIFKHYFDKAETLEFTIENPNENFDRIRDICDLEFLRSLPEFTSLKLNESIVLPHHGGVPQLIAGGDVNDIRRASKIAPRQFNRVLEMQIMSKLPASVRPSLSQDEKPKSTKEDRYLQRLWEIFAKQRLYRHNKDVLVQMEPTERVESLHKTLQGVEFGYCLVLEPRPSTEEDWEDDDDGNDAGPSTNGKRKSEELNGEPSSKRARVDDE